MTADDQFQLWWTYWRDRLTIEHPGCHPSIAVVLAHLDAAGYSRRRTRWLNPDPPRRHRRKVTT